MTKKQLIIQYVFYIPIASVLGVGAITFLFYLSYGWSVGYALSWFKVASIFIVILFYIFNFNVLVKVLKRKNGS
jgi:hypothetical protein